MSHCVCHCYHCHRCVTHHLSVCLYVCLCIYISLSDSVVTRRSGLPIVWAVFWLFVESATGVVYLPALRLAVSSSPDFIDIVRSVSPAMSTAQAIADSVPCQLARLDTLATTLLPPEGSASATSTEPEKQKGDRFVRQMMSFFVISLNTLNSHLPRPWLTCPDSY